MKLFDYRVTIPNFNTASPGSNDSLDTNENMQGIVTYISLNSHDGCAGGYRIGPSVGCFEFFASTVISLREQERDL